MTFTKSELTAALVEELKLTKSEAHTFVCNFFDEIVKILEAGYNLKLSGIGKFILRDKKARPGRNPKTKEPVPVSERRVVTFQASQTLKNKMLANYRLKNKKSEKIQNPNTIEAI